MDTVSSIKNLIICIFVKINNYEAKDLRRLKINNIRLIKKQAKIELCEKKISKLCRVDLKVWRPIIHMNVIHIQIRRVKLNIHNSNNLNKKL
jgi:hypothetical protein